MKWLSIILLTLLSVALNTTAWPHFLHRNRLQKLRQKNFLQNLFPVRSNCDIADQPQLDIIVDNGLGYDPTTQQQQQQGFILTFGPPGIYQSSPPSLQYTATNFNGQFLNQLSPATIGF